MVKNMNKRDIPSLLIILLYVIVNFIVSYINMNDYIIVILIILGLGATVSLNLNVSKDTKNKKSFLTFLLALALEILINFFSAFIFESGIVLNKMKTLFNADNKLISLYCIVGVLVIKELIIYFKNLNYSTFPPKN